MCVVAGLGEATEAAVTSVAVAVILVVVISEAVLTAAMVFTMDVSERVHSTAISGIMMQAAGIAGVTMSGFVPDINPS